MMVDATRLLFGGSLVLWVAGAVALPADSRGQLPDLDAPVQRIISLAPNVTELLFEAGAGERIVGTVAYSDYPPEAAAIQRIGDAFRVDVESVLALEADLVVAWETGNPTAVVSQLEALGLPVFTVEPVDLDGISDALRDLGELLGTTDVANARATEFAGRLAELRTGFQGRPQVRVFHQVDVEPLYTIGGGHLISQALTLCGGQNIFADINLPAAAVGQEAVVAAAPDVIFGPRIEGVRPLDHWRRFPAVPAVAKDNLLIVDADRVSRATPRMLEGIVQLCTHLDAARGRLGIEFDPTPSGAAALLAADQAFASLSQVSGPSRAFAAYMMEDGLGLPDGRGPVSAAELIAGLDQPGLELVRQPQQAEVAASGELGWSWGTWRIPVPDGAALRGKYLNVWRRIDGLWYVQVDIGNQGVAEGTP